MELLGEPVEIVVDLTADDDGDVEVETRLVVGERATSGGGDVRLIGQPAHGVWFQQGETLHLGRLERPVPPAVGALIAGDAVRVPAADVDELLNDVQPVLARFASVGSPDGSVETGVRRFDGLALVVDRPSVEVAHLQWHVRYRRGDSAQLLPWYGPASAMRDAAAELDASRALDVPGHVARFLLDPAGRPADRTVERDDAVAFFADALPWLEDHESIEVEVRGGQPELREATADPVIALSVLDAPHDAEAASEGADTDWFDLDVEVSVDGERVDFVPLFTALTTDEEALYLPSGMWLRLDRPEFVQLRELIVEARGLVDARRGAGGAGQPLPDRLVG